MSGDPLVPDWITEATCVDMRQRMERVERISQLLAHDLVNCWACAEFFDADEGCHHGRELCHFCATSHCPECRDDLREDSTYREREDR